MDASRRAAAAAAAGDGGHGAGAPAPGGVAVTMYGTIPAPAGEALGTGGDGGRPPLPLPLARAGGDAHGTIPSSGAVSSSDPGSYGAGLAHATAAGAHVHGDGVGQAHRSEVAACAVAPPRQRPSPAGFVPPAATAPPRGGAPPAPAAAPRAAHPVPPDPVVPSAAVTAPGGAGAAPAHVPVPLADPPRRRRVLLAVSGSVAAVKWPQLVLALASFADVRVATTKASRAFHTATEAYDADGLAAAGAVLRATEAREAAAGRFTHPSVTAAPLDAAAAAPAAGASSPVPLFTDADEWHSYKAVHVDAVVHIELRKWADVLLVAPMSANTLAKVATGLADNIVTCVARAWELRNDTKAFLAAPAMNTAMLEHPITAPQLATLRSWGVVVLPTAPPRRLACGDVGGGAMAAVGDLVALARAACDGGDAWRVALATLAPPRPTLPTTPLS